MQKHNQRETSNSKNIDIDKTKSDLNYDLHNDGSIKYKERIDDIIQDNYTGKKAIRKDAVVMTSTIITSDKDFFDRLGEQETKRFFQESYDKLKNMYGEQNIVSACVHMDEKTPHMHLIAVPLTSEGKLSAKECFTREKLRSLQDEIPKHLQNEGFAVERGKENSTNKHIEINEFKKQTLEKVKNELDKDLKELENIKSSLQDIKSIEHSKIPLTSRITIKEDDFNKLMDMAQKGLDYKEKNANLESQVNHLKFENEHLDKTATLQCGRANKAIEKNNILQNNFDNLNLKSQAMHKTLDSHDLLSVAQKVLSEIIKGQDVEIVQSKSQEKERVR